MLQFTKSFNQETYKIWVIQASVYSMTEYNRWLSSLSRKWSWNELVIYVQKISTDDTDNKNKAIFINCLNDTVKDDRETSGNLQKAVLSNTQSDLILTRTKIDLQL